MTPQPGASPGDALFPLGPAVSRSAPVGPVPAGALLPPFAAGVSSELSVEGGEVATPRGRVEVEADLLVAPPPPDLHTLEGSAGDAVPAWLMWDDEEAEAEPLIAPAATAELPAPRAEGGEPRPPSYAPLAGYPEIEAASEEIQEKRADGPRSALEVAAQAPGDPAMEELAARLERLAAALRNRGIAGIAGDTSTDSLALLVAGFALGTMQRRQGG